MKNIRHILLACSIAATLAACNSWLSDTPFDKVPGDELYATEQGAQEALNGLYMAMLDRSIYGRELTFGLVEVLAQHYSIPEKHTYQLPAAYDLYHDNSKAFTVPVWSNLYSLISACNVFIEQAEQHKDRYDAAHYNLLRGEAIALRAYLHFDLFRLFAPACTDANKAERAIPYYDKEVQAPVDYLTVEQVTPRLLADIDAAIALLAADPVLQGTTLSRGEGFWDYRNYRLNIYAAWALKARVLLHAGNKPAANAIAAALLTGKTPEGAAANFMTVFPSVLGLLPNYKEPVGCTEVIFGMHDVDRSNIQRDYFTTDLLPERILLAGEPRYNVLFTYAEDIRKNTFADVTNHVSATGLKAIVKYQRGQLLAVDPYPYRYETLPLIKKAEIYLIAAETSNNDVDKASWLNLLRLERGYLQDNTDAYAGNLDQLLRDEYEREFYAEGQYIYYLKRNAVATIPTQSGGNIAPTLTLPVPDAEDNNRQ
ncbi:MAG: RagB/SusD family nutrient uptake outer membrane protein [Odoribacteraceae bacterium]|jgi:hypothetical protein|nr:RagB/SusD family nutrient uptake outer membrane protein [Odoribacteraceae bacterium]